jgi:hypothetical protein
VIFTGLAGVVISLAKKSRKFRILYIRDEDQMFS